MEPNIPFDTEVVKFFPDKHKKRTEWGAINADSVDHEFQVANDLVLTFTGSDPCSTTAECAKAVKDMQTRDKASGLPDIRHNFVIGGDGYVYIGRSWTESPVVPKQYEPDRNFTLSVAYIGHFGDKPTEEQINAFNDLLAVGRVNYLIVEKKLKIHEYLNEDPY